MHSQPQKSTALVSQLSDFSGLLRFSGLFFF
jgi:hypothetical protein